MNQQHALRLLILAAGLPWGLLSAAAPADSIETIDLLNESTSTYTLEYCDADQTPLSVQVELGKPFFPITRAGDRIKVPAASAGTIHVMRIHGALHGSFRLRDPYDNTTRIDIKAGSPDERPDLVTVGPVVPGVELTVTPKLAVAIVKGTLK